MEFHCIISVINSLSGRKFSLIIFSCLHRKKRKKYDEKKSLYIYVSIITQSRSSLCILEGYSWEIFNID